eukprot:scpid15649/ scgid31708/ 
MLRQRRRLVQCLNVAGGLLLNKTFPIGEGRSPHRETFKNSRTLCGALPEGEALFATGLQSTVQRQLNQLQLPLLFSVVMSHLLLMKSKGPEEGSTSQSNNGTDRYRKQ